MADDRRRRRPRPPGGGGPPADRTGRPLLGGGERLLQEIERAGGGGGDGWHFRSFSEAFAHLAPQATQMVDALAVLPAAARGPHVVVEATIQPSYLASSHYPEALFRAANLYPVGTRQARGTYRTEKKAPRENEPTKTYLLAGDDRAVQRFAALIAEGPERGRTTIWKQIREFEEIGLRRQDGVLRGLPDDALDEEVITWEAVLTGLGSDAEERAALGALTLERFDRFVKDRGGEIDREYIRAIDGLTFLPIALSVGDARRVVQFNSLRVLRPMPHMGSFESVRRSTTRPVGKTVPASASPTTAITQERVAVFDGGMNPRDVARGTHVRLHEVSPDPAEDEGIDHGTMVTNAVLYGYAATSTPRPRPLVSVDHYRIVPAPSSTGTFDRDCYWMLDQIERCVLTGGHRLVNLSIGPPLTMDEDAEPHRWTAALDKLAASHGVLFITAVGNNGAHHAPRVCVPADMANGIAVGACTSRDPATRVARATYSAIGPGRSGQRVVPLGVSFGGTDGEPFLGLGPGNAVMEGEGTSLAAPLVTHGIAGLRAGLGGTPRCETLRAFAAHFAHGDAEVDHDERHIGYGRLRESYDGVWSGAQNEVTLLYEVDMARHGLIALPAPYPVGIPDSVMVDLDYTICYTSQVQLGYAAEYTRAGLITTFRPHARKYRLYATGTEKPEVLEKAVDVVADEQRIIQTYGKLGFKFGGHPLSDPGTTRKRWEGDQRAGGKWETLLRTHHRLRARNLYAPRLDLEYLARDGSQLATGEVAKLPVSILLTIRVPTAIDLYELARSQFPALVELRPRVRVPAAAPIRVTGRP